MSNPHPAISITQLCVTLQTQIVLDSINLVIPQGIMGAIIGPNGAGKTTLLKSIVGLIKVQQGRILVLGEDFTRCRQQIGYVPQRALVDWDFPATALDIAVMGTFAKRGWFRQIHTSDYDSAYKALEMVGMHSSAHTPIHALSGGQQQRVLLARALAQDAHLYIMDEPFVGVDMATEQSIIHTLQKLRSAGKTILVVHHDLQTVQEYFDWSFLLNVRSIAAGPTQEVLTREHLLAAYGRIPACIP